jgi:hypothetical protein
MTRPIYETESDRQNQMSVADTISVFIGKKLVKTRQMASVDYVVEDLKGVATGLMEIKVRNYTPEQMDALGGFFLSERKLLIVYGVVQALKMDFHLVVKTPSCLLHMCLKYDSTWPKLERKFGGRFDRGDEKDAETVCLFPTTMFTRINDDIATVPAGST